MLLGVLAAMVALRPASLRPRVEAALSDGLKLDATIGSLVLSFAPRPRVSGTGVVLRIPGRADLPPFATVDRFWVEIGLIPFLRGRVDTIHMEGLKIVVPPPGTTGVRPDRGAGYGAAARILVSHLDARDGSLTILRRKPNDPPFVFDVHALVVDDLGLDRRMHFVASLTNPIPAGEIDADGTVGPWPGSDVWNLPVAGRYTLSHANLGTINGIGGEMTSSGTFSGQLTEIVVVGHEDTPRFSLDLGGQPVPLSASFRAVVDASDGSTRLDSVDARVFESAFQAEGAVLNLPGPGNHSIDLKVTMNQGRVEDLLKLVLDASRPTLTGDATFKAAVSIPPGPERFRDRLRVVGQFGLDAARFTDAQIQDHIIELSRRSQGKDKDDPIGRVMTSLSGSFELARGVLMLRRFSFYVPGARVDLTGTYALASGKIDMQGTLRMQATVSQAVGGVRSIFLKPFDALFKKHGAGAVVPITITGTRDQPKFGVQMGKVIK